MKHGFVKVAAATPDIRVADVEYNTEQICRLIDETAEEEAKVVVFPELCITGYTCGDLFTQDLLLENAKKGLQKIATHTGNKDGIFFIGMPLAVDGELYNVAAAVNHGHILGFTTKTFLPNYGEFYEMRQFCAGPKEARMISFDGKMIPFGPQILFVAEEMQSLVIAAEICEDVWSTVPPSIQAAREGAVLIVNCSASDETIGKATYRKNLIEGQSARLLCGYIYANAGEGESTTDVVFGGHNIIAENGTTLAMGQRFVNNVIYTEIDIKRLLSERRKNTTFQLVEDRKLMRVPFDMKIQETKLTRAFYSRPFVPGEEGERARRCEEILTIQAMGLKKRLAHTHAKSAVVGISGGLDSTLALLVCVKTFDKLGLPRKDILGVTMPGFGTTDRTYNNAIDLMKSLGISIREISIQDACIQHFKDIDHDINVHDVTYENSQARERTQILMDIANQTWGMVVGTGDLSELALGWATYNGDHMSMYGVNGSIPKTLVKYLVQWVAENDMDEDAKATLLDIVDTPISPELIPADENGEIKQKTEDLVGPYELHDFFLYYFLRFGFRPSKIYYLANIAFKDVYDKETIKKWLSTFFRRFFNQQFKRSCLPDGPKVGSISISPRGDWRMPSDASSTIWLKEIEDL